MNEQDYSFVAKQLLDRAAIVLEPGKEYLLESRLGPVAKRHGLASVGDFIRQLRFADSNGLFKELVEAMVTTETSFFRDIHPFDTLRRTVIPELIRARTGERQLNIWCAASSSGQEPYTLAIILREYFPELFGWKINFLSSDISEDMLKRCREANYSQIEVNRGLPTALLLKYFRQEGARWQLADEIRAMVNFKPLNLAQPWPHIPQMDLVLMRNVMIYFDVETKKNILGRLKRILRADGYLILGGAETTFNLDESYRRVESLKGGFYRLAEKS
jgi:chemotaxis protein methyltransferase CheR